MNGSRIGKVENIFDLRIAFYFTILIFLNSQYPVSIEKTAINDQITGIYRKGYLHLPDGNLEFILEL